MVKEFDVIVVGSGGGTKLVRPVAALGLKVAIIEKDKLGGTCLNRGCIPSKMLIHPADVATIMREADRFNFDAVTPKVHFEQLVERVSSTIDQDSDSIAPAYEKDSNITLIRGAAKFIDDKTLEVNGEKITAPKIFLGIGARPSIPHIEGLENTPYMTSTEALRVKKQPKKLLVIGGGYIAVELGYFFGAIGTEVHFIVRSKLLRNQDPDVQTEFSKSFKQRFNVHEGCKPIKVEHKDDTFTVTCENETLTGDALLIAGGVTPWTDQIGIENTSIELDDKGFIKVDDHLKTKSPNVWALGDCIGKYLFRHSVNFEGEYLFHTLFKEKKPEPIVYPPMPAAVFTHPQIASVGLTEPQAIEQNIPYFIGMNRFEDSAMGMALCSTEGFVKLIFEKQSEKLIGAHIIGDEASNMIHMLIYAMTFNATRSDLLSMIYIHPALPEIVRNAARKAKIDVL